MPAPTRRPACPLSSYLILNSEANVKVVCGNFDDDQFQPGEFRLNLPDCFSLGVLKNLVKRRY